MRARRRTHHSPVAWSRSDEEFQSQTPRPAWDAAWDRVRAERKQAGLPNTYEDRAIDTPHRNAYPNCIRLYSRSRGYSGQREAIAFPARNGRHMPTCLDTAQV